MFGEYLSAKINLIPGCQFPNGGCPSVCVSLDFNIILLIASIFWYLACPKCLLSLESFLSSGYEPLSFLASFLLHMKFTLLVLTFCEISAYISTIISFSALFLVFNSFLFCFLLQFLLLELFSHWPLGYEQLLLLVLLSLLSLP